MSEITIRDIHGITINAPATIIGQMAFHHPMFMDGREDAEDTSSWVLTHVRSGCYIEELEGGTLESELAGLCIRLASFDFDAYYANGCDDAEFVTAVKKLIWEWNVGTR